MTDNKTWKQKKLDYIAFIYGRKLSEYEGHNDDRRLYINMYNIITEAINSLPDEPNNYICCAVNHKLDEDFAVMDDIKAYFDGKKSR